MSARVMQQLRGGHMYVLALGVLVIVVGMAFIFGGLWLNWDLINSVYDQIPKTNSLWQFCLPAYVVCYDYNHWSAPFDIAMGFMLFGAFLELLGSFVAFIAYENMHA